MAHSMLLHAIATIFVHYKILHHPQRLTLGPIQVSGLFACSAASAFPSILSTKFDNIRNKN